MKHALNWLLIAFMSIFIASCSDSDNNDDNPDAPTLEIAKTIVGEWLLSTSDADNSVAMEFTEASRVNAKIVRDGYVGTGSGYYAVEGETLSGSYTNDRGQTTYFDWIVTEVDPFEIDIDIYDENFYLGEAELNRIVAEQNIETGSPVKPDYRSLCGTSNVSAFESIDPSIAAVVYDTGEITGQKEGTTFVTFSTPNGRAVLRVTVTSSVKSFAENIIGTWIYDDVTIPDWESFTFSENGYALLMWQTKDHNTVLDEQVQTTYTVDGETVSYKVNVAAGQMNMRMVTETITDYDWTYRSFDSGVATGKYTIQRLLETKTLQPQETWTPDYLSLVGYNAIQGLKSHNEAVAKVSATGEIVAVANGRTYIDVKTAKGTGVVEVKVEGGVIPVAFEECLGKPASKTHELLGSKPYYEDETIIMYKDITPDIDLVGVSLDSWSGLGEAVVVNYKSTVNAASVTSVLDATFVPYMSQTTATFKAYINSADRADATVGVTWDTEKLSLTYVNLARDLFPDYSVLIGMNRTQVIKKMGREPDVNNDQSQSFFFFDNKGVKIVSAYYTDFVSNFNDVRSVVTMLDDNFTVEQVTAFMKKKYPYYPEYSSEEELVFVPEGHKMEIMYMPKEKMIMYISTGTSAAAKKALKLKARSVNR